MRAYIRVYVSFIQELLRVEIAFVVLSFALISGSNALANGLGGTSGERLKSVVHVIEDYKSPGLEAELSGIYPDPTNNNLYYVLANKRPPYRYGQKPMLAEEYRGKLLAVEKSTGKIVKAIKLAEDDFGGLVLADGYFYAALTNAAEILKLNPTTFEILARYRLPSPAGGLGYDSERGVLIAQLYVGHPHLAVVDVKTGVIIDSLWSDESAMGLAKVDGDWLCTWASGWDPGSFSELRVIDQKTGRVLERMRLDGVHTAIAPDKDSKGGPAFISLMTIDSRSGATVIRKFSYQGKDNASLAHQQEEAQADRVMVRQIEESRFAKVAGAPNCLQAAVQRGDPTNGPSTMLFKANGNCVIPWHWHSANEQWMVVSGTARVQMKGEGRMASLRSGSFVYTPARHVHQFSCTGCMIFRTLDSPLDIHYVDQAGKEISLDEALKLNRRHH